MAIRTCDPTTGSIGRQTYMLLNGIQVVRNRVIPSNPSTEAQVLVRGYMTLSSQAWDALTDAQRAAWSAKAALLRSKSRLGQSRPLTGNQLFCKVNDVARLTGATPVTDPPADPVFEDQTITALTAKNITGTVTLEVTVSGTLQQGSFIRGAAPVKAGVARPPQMFYLGAAPSAVGGKLNIATLYTTKFGAPAVGSRVFVEVVKCDTMWEGPAVVLDAVTAAS